MNTKKKNLWPQILPYYRPALQNSDAKLQLYYLKKYNKSFSLEW